MLNIFKRVCRKQVVRPSQISSGHSFDAGSANTQRCNRIQRIMSMRLEHTKMVRPRHCKELESAGIATCGDIAKAKVESIQFDHGQRMTRHAVKYQAAVLLALSVDGLSPRNALLLTSIHRTNLHSIASDSPAKLRNDIVRFSQSTQGQKLLRGRKLPSSRRIRLWINYCRESTGMNTVSENATSKSQVSRLQAC